MLLALAMRLRSRPTKDKEAHALVIRAMSKRLKFPDGGMYPKRPGVFDADISRAMAFYEITTIAHVADRLISKLCLTQRQGLLLGACKRNPAFAEEQTGVEQHLPALSVAPEGYDSLFS